MKFTLKKSEILKPLNNVRNIINTKSMKPILQNMLLDISEGEMTIEGSDLEVGIRCRLDIASVEESGRMTFPAEKLTKIVSEAPREEIMVMVDGDKAYIASGNAKFELSILPADDYPEFPSFDSTGKVTIPFSQLREMIEKTIIGTAVDSARYVFRGILFEYEDGMFNLVATDSHILAKASARPSECTVEDSMKVVVPRKVLEEVLKFDHEGDVDITFNNQNIRFDFDDVVLVSRLIDAKYPKYDKVIPTINDKTAQIPRAELLETFRRVSVFINRESGRTSMDFSGEKLKVTARLSDVGTAEDIIPVKYEKGDLRIDFNYKYLKDILSTVVEDSISFSMYNNESAVVVRPEGREDYLWVVMPLVMLD